MTADAVIAEARSWIGTPYVAQASLKGIGCDCAGLIHGVGRSLGLVEGALPPAYVETDLDVLSRELGRCCMVAMEVAPAAVLVFRVARRRRHLAICTGEGIVHVYGRKYGVTEHVLSPKWLALLESIWRYRGLDG